MALERGSRLKLSLEFFPFCQYLLAIQEISDLLLAMQARLALPPIVGVCHPLFVFEEWFQVDYIP